MPEPSPIDAPAQSCLGPEVRDVHVPVHAIDDDVLALGLWV